MGCLSGAPPSSVRRMVALPVTTWPLTLRLSSTSPRFFRVCWKQISRFRKASAFVWVSSLLSSPPGRASGLSMGPRAILGV